jgi:hypothetical protein
MDVSARTLERRRLSVRARSLAWRRLDAMGPMDARAHAERLLRLLHPTLPDASLRQVLDQLREAEAEGRWAGFERPPDLPVR